MTSIEDLEEVCFKQDLAIYYLGLATAKTRKARPWCCSIGPVVGGRWKPQEFAIRGEGINLRGAVEDALTQLTVFLLERSAVEL